jgi:orotidine-5'-phosphate decarboxylase
MRLFLELCSLFLDPCSLAASPGNWYLAMFNDRCRNPSLPMFTPFLERFSWAIQRVGFPLCIGLDPAPEKLPPHLGPGGHALLPFLTDIVESTRHLVAAYKPNTAFFEAYGPEGWAVLEQLRDIIGPEPLLIVDGKRGDIEHTNAAYAHALFERVRADAVTVQPYLGGGPLEPFVRHPGRGVFVLCVTSNSGAELVQNLPVGGRPLHLEIAHQARSWSEHANVGLVVGSTKPQALDAVLHVAADLPMLIPGGGAQGGESSRVMELLREHNASGLLNFSRSVLYASDGTDFADAARHEVLRLREELA